MKSSENRKTYLDSIERMVRATYPAFKIKDVCYSAPINDVRLDDISNGLFSLENDDDMIRLARNYVKTIDLQSPSCYETDTIEKKLAIIKDIGENEILYGPVLDIKGWRELYKRIFKKCWFNIK